MRPALNAMHADPSHPWTLAELALRANLSRSSFAVAFRAAVQQTPGEYLTAWRMSVAQDRLRHSDPLKRIHAQVGYHSAAAFSRVFKQHVGLAPRDWLRQHRQN